MATIGSISVAFEAELGGLREGIDELLKSFEELSDSVESVSKKFDDLDGRRVTVAVSVDTTAVDLASSKVKDLSGSIKSSGGRVSVDVEVDGEAEEELNSSAEAAERLRQSVTRASASFAAAFSNQVVASVKAYGTSLKELGESAVKATRSLGGAVTAVGGFLDGTALSVDGIVKAVGRSFSAFNEWKEVLAAAGLATGAFLTYAGGLRVVVAAASGNVGAMARVFAAAGGAVAVAGAGLAVYSGVVAIARVATSQLSQESQGYVVSATKAAAATSVAAAALYSGNAAFNAIYQAMRTSSTTVEAFSKVAGSASASAVSGFAKVAASLARLNLLLNIAKVFSGAYRKELEAMGQQASSIRDMADRFGSTTQELQILARAASDAGVSMGFLAKGQQNLFTSLSKIKIGQLNTESTREAKIAFDRLGISIEDLRSKRPQEVFDLVAERLTAVEDASDRTAIAFDLFGKQGAAILPALKNLKEVQADAARLGTTLRDIEFTAFDDVGKSFNRVREASKNLSQALLLPLTPIQTGWNNLVADVQGGIVAAFGPIATIMAKAVVPLQVFFEATGRVVNILLRLAGAAATVYVALVPPANTLAGPWKVLGSAIMDVLGVVEVAVGVIEGIAEAFLTELTPAVDKFMAPANSFAEWLTKIGVFAGYFGLVVAAIAVTNAAFQTMAIASGAAAASSAGSAGLISIAYTKMSAAVVASLARVKAALGITSLPFEGLAKAALGAFKWIVVGATETATVFSTKMVVMGLSAIQGWIAPFLAGVASFVTGTTIASTAATISAAAMAAAWVVATLGIAAIVVGIIALIQNFDSLYDYFSNFSDNVGRLFTWDGIVEAASAVADAIYNAFDFVFGAIGRLFSGLAARVLSVFSGIKPAAEVEKIDAAAAKAEEVARKRREVAQVEWEQRRAVQVEFNAMKATPMGQMALGSLPDLEIEPPPVDETEALVSALESARDSMGTLTVEAGRFGAAGKTAIVAAQQQFAKLQQQLSEGKLTPGSGEDGLSEVEIFEKRAKKIRSDLQKNLDLSNVLSTETVNDFAQSVAKSFDALQVRFDKLARGSDLGSTFSANRYFPTSNAIKQEAQRVSNELAAEEARIAKKLAEGGFGNDANASKRAAAELEDVRFIAEREFGKIEADVAFAAEIRKALEDAFLSPVEEYEKRLKEIQDNKSLTPVEKSLASVAEQKKFVEQNFGKTTGDTLREREAAFGKATAVDQYGRTAFMSAEGTSAEGNARAAMERNRLDMGRREALGLEATPAQSLQAGIDNINDIFGTAGLTIEQIQDKLSPAEFAEYQEALKKNTDAVKASLGVEKTGAQQIAEQREKLAKAVADNVITQEEAAKAEKAARDNLLSSLGISKSPAEAFEDAAEKIRENAAELSDEEVAKGLKEAKDKLLSALGIPKSPVEEAEKRLDELAEAFGMGSISAEELAKGAKAAKDSLLQSLGIPLDPVAQFAERLSALDDALEKGLISQEQFAQGQDEARRTMLPGGDEKSPLKQFQQDIDAITRAREEGLISEEDFAQRRMNLQAGLEDSMGAALDSVAPDRRQVGSSDVRSQAGVDTFFRILQGRDNPSLKAQLEIARNTKLLADAAQDPDAAPVIANFAAR
jgi:hypothetical protein